VNREQFRRLVEKAVAAALNAASASLNSWASGDVDTARKARQACEEAIEAVMQAWEKKVA
jgi:hypothetical protein